MKISKRILFITFFAICILTNFAFASSGKVNIEATRIRKEANTTSDIITVIYKNDEIEILEESGDWYKIKYKDDTGYVKKEFITASKEESKTQKPEETKKPEVPEVPEVPEQPAELVDESTLIITSESYGKFLPSFSSSNIIKFETGKNVKQIKELNNWIQVTDGKNTGWVLKTKTKSAVQEAQSQTPAEPENTVVENNNTNTVENKVDNTVSNNTVANNTVTNIATSGNKKAIITVETAKVRAKASTSSETLGFLDYGDEIVLLEKDGDWYRINFENKTGYVKNTLFKIIDEPVSSRSLTEEREEIKQEEVKETEKAETPEASEPIISSNTSGVVDYAKQYLGYPYIVGGKNPTTGFDCSGFTRYVFLNFGYSLGATAASQTNIGTEISRDDLKPGDLILFLNEEKTGIGHTGIYLDRGEFIHAANPQRGVVTDNLNTNSYYNERFVSARRIVQ